MKERIDASNVQVLCSIHLLTCSRLSQVCLSCMAVWAAERSVLDRASNRLYIAEFLTDWSAEPSSMVVGLAIQGEAKPAESMPQIICYAISS